MHAPSRPSRMERRLTGKILMGAIRKEMLL